MKVIRLSLVCILMATVFFNGCKSVNLGGTGQIGTVTGGGSVNIPVFRADDQASNEE